MDCFVGEVTGKAKGEKKGDMFFPEHESWSLTDYQSGAWLLCTNNRSIHDYFILIDGIWKVTLRVRRACYRCNS